MAIIFKRLTNVFFNLVFIIDTGFVIAIVILAFPYIGQSLMMGLLCGSALLVPPAVIFFIRARMIEYRAAHNGQWLGKEQLHFKDWRD